MNHPIHPHPPIILRSQFQVLPPVTATFSHIRDDGDDDLACFEAPQGLVYVSGESYRWIVVLVGINTSALIWV